MDLHKERSRLAADIEAVIADVNQLVRATGDEARADVRELQERVSSKLADLKQRLDGIERSALERARYTARATDEYVHDHPWTAVAAAAGAAMLVGALLGRRR